MKIIFMGSPEFAVDVFHVLLSSQHDVVAVYTRKPQPAKRGKKIIQTPVHVVAQANNIKVCTTDSFKSMQGQESFRSFMPDVGVVAAYGLILPPEVLSIPKYGCINIHPSLLPRWRGATPIQHTILAGDKETGVSIMQVSKELDAGPILKQEKFLIEESDNYSTLHDKLSKLGSYLLLEVLNEITKLIPTAQNDSYACYAHKIQDYKIYAHDNCEAAYRKVLAFYPKSFIKIDNRHIRILSADCKINRLPSIEQGKIINNQLHIGLHGGVLMPKIVQMEGRVPCNIDDFMRGLRGIDIQKKFIE